MSTVFEPQRVVVRDEDDVFWPSSLSPDVLSVVVVEPEALSIADLWIYVEYLDNNTLDSSRYRLAFWIKVATPLATLTMLLLTVPLVFGSLRSVGAGQRIFIGVMIGIAFFLSNNLLNHLGLVYGLAPLPSALLPTALFFLISTYFAARVR